MSMNLHIYVGPNLQVKMTRQELWDYTEEIKESLFFIDANEAGQPYTPEEREEDYRLLPNRNYGIGRETTFSRDGNLSSVDNPNKGAEVIQFLNTYKAETQRLANKGICWQVMWSILPYFS